MKKILCRIMTILNYNAGDDCPQCHNGRLRDSGIIINGDRVISCTNCQWEVRENT